ncbi:MAG: PAS domain-containing sensor histidine kinase, partial [Pirellulaceae bacterium]|nr:PAS domain-containing sensor histidine kinase [Pirellulaceae bacterium]
DKVFALFQRLEVGNDGTGVGLAAVTRIMETHGGRAWVESEEGKGATFWIEFPNQ